MMIQPKLEIDSSLKLVAPDVKHAAITMKWRSGEQGRITQALMGVAPGSIREPTLEEEQKLIQHFIDTPDEIVWMIKYDEKIVGAVEVHLNKYAEIKSPNISIMIGGAAYRGKGIGVKTMQTVLAYLTSHEGYSSVYARYLVTNIASEKLNRRVGFKPLGEPYIDEDGLEWQNVKYD